MTDTKDAEINIEATIYAAAMNDSSFAIAYALLQVARALNDIQDAVRVVAESIDDVSDSLEKIAPKSATQTFLDEIGAP